MGAFHAQHVRGAPAHRPERPAAGAVLARPAAGHGFLGTTVAKRAAVSSTESKPDHVTESEPEFVAKPKRVLNVTVPEPEFTGSDRLRRLAAIKPAHALAGSH